MIVFHNVKGSKETTLHTFTLSVQDMDLIFSPGSYFQSNVLKYESKIQETISITPPTTFTNYEVWLTTNGFQVIQRTNETDFEPVTNPIDRIAWFSLQPSETLEETDIHFVQIQ
jgi:alpha/beta superfamily hydrolase